MDLDIIKLNSQVERIIADRVTKDSSGDMVPEYLVKWRGLSYAEATWEKEVDIAFAQDAINEYKRTKDLDTVELLEQLPALQQLLFHLLACQPKGAARNNLLIQYALTIVATESIKLYVAITDGTLNLIDKFFEIQRHDAVRALEIYKEAGNQVESLSELLEICRGLGFGHGQKYIKIEQPPASFMTAMEDYVKDASQILMLPWRPE